MKRFIEKMPERSDIEELKKAIAKLTREISELKHSKGSLKSEKKILDEILNSLPGTFYIWDDQSLYYPIFGDRCS